MHSPQTESLARPSTAWLVRAFETIRALLRTIKVARRERALRICETLPLGDKRFLAVIQIEGRRFLIGGTNQSISLLERLDSAATPRAKREPSPENTYLSGVN
jgi:flagellar biogenesis protein FliO